MNCLHCSYWICNRVASGSDRGVCNPVANDPAISEQRTEKNVQRTGWSLI
jgi:hypothetical protein